MAPGVVDWSWNRRDQRKQREWKRLKGGGGEASLARRVTEGAAAGEHAYALGGAEGESMAPRRRGWEIGKKGS